MNSASFELAFEKFKADMPNNLPKHLRGFEADSGEIYRYFFTMRLNAAIQSVSQTTIWHGYTSTFNQAVEPVIKAASDFAYNKQVLEKREEFLFGDYKYKPASVLKSILGNPAPNRTGPDGCMVMSLISIFGAAVPILLRYNPEAMRFIKDNWPVPTAVAGALAVALVTAITIKEYTRHNKCAEQWRQEYPQGFIDELRLHAKNELATNIGMMRGTVLAV